MKSYFVGDCRRFLTSVLSILLIAVGLVAQDDLIRVETNLISVPTQVMDKDGRYISNLSVENFSIFEDGVLQKVEYFGPVDSPFTVLVLLDCSGSMTLHLDTMAKAAESLIGQLRPEDQLMVYAFADDTEEILPRTRVGALRNIERSKIEIRIKQSSATWVYDAVEVAQKKLESIRGRKAIVLFSDAISLDRAATAKKNLKEAEEKGTIIYTVRFGEIPTRRPEWLAVQGIDDSRIYSGVAFDDAYSTGKIINQRDLNAMGNGKLTPKQVAKETEKIKGYMDGLAMKTGARSYHIDEIDDLATTFAEVAAELGRQYTLGYYSNQTRNVERRKITVKVNIPNVAVRSRNEVVFKKK